MAIPWRAPSRFHERLKPERSMVDSDLPFTITAAPSHPVGGMVPMTVPGGAIVGKGIRDHDLL